MMRILVIRRDNIGDLVCTTPLIAGIRRRFPGAHIAALVNSYNAAVLEGNPDLSAVHIYTKLKHRLPGESTLQIVTARLRMLVELRREPFDYIVLASSSFNRHGLRFARQLRRRQVVGFANGDEPGAKHVTIRLPAKPYTDLHEVQLLALLGEAIGVPHADGPLRVFPDIARVAEWQQRLLEPRSQSGRSLVAVHISGRWPKQWPAEKWMQVIERLTRANVGVVVVWSPGPDDDPRHPGDDHKAKRVIDGVANPLVLGAPTATLRDLIALLSLCQAFIGVDSGAMHLAAALGLPIVALFQNLGWNHQRWHPWRVAHELVTSRSQNVSDIAVEQVLESWARLSQSALDSRVVQRTLR